MPDDTPDLPTGDAPDPAIAPPSPGLQSGSAGGTPQGGVLPPSASAPPTGGGMHPAGLHTVGMEGMRKIMGAMHMFRSMLDPSSEEAKAADKMFNAGRKHFIPDMQSAQSGQMPPMNMGAGAPAGGPPQMKGPQGGAMLPAVNPQNMPTGPAPMRQ